jgi:phosphatidylserine/phosphatidylglycerophosphate/cardiolipin synthase-like enzyme
MTVFLLLYIIPIMSLTMRLERSNQSGKYVIDRLFGAHTYAFICSPYISEQYAKEIVRLAKNGTIVKVLTSDKITERGFIIRDFFKEAKRTDGLDTLKTLVMKHRGQSFEHSKMYIVDDNYSVVGSANLTRPGMWENSEILYISETPIDVKHARDIFETAWKDALKSAFGDNNGGRNNYGQSRRYGYRPQPKVKVETEGKKGSIFDAIVKELKSWTE